MAKPTRITRAKVVKDNEAFKKGAIIVGKYIGLSEFEDNIKRNL